MSKVMIMDHPLIQHKIGIIRRQETGSKDFRQLISEIAMLMCYEATRDLKLTDVEIETPISKMTAKELAGKMLAAALWKTDSLAASEKDFYTDSAKTSAVETEDYW